MESKDSLFSGELKVFEQITRISLNISLEYRIIYVMVTLLSSIVATWLKFDGFLMDGYPKMLRRRIILGSKRLAKT